MTQIYELLKLGGPAMFILLFLSVACVTLVLIKTWEFWELRLGRRDFVPRVLDTWQRGNEEEALSLLTREPSPLARVMAAAIAGRRNPRISEAALREQITQLASEKLESARSLLRPLEVIAGLAPLLGLLGTVLGMIKVFQKLQDAGDRVSPSLLSGGLWEALLTTAGGLAVAIIALAAFHTFDRQVDRLRQAMESALTRIFTNMPVTPVAMPPPVTGMAVDLPQERHDAAHAN